MAEREDQLKFPLIRVREESERAVLKLNIKKNRDHGIWCHHFMASRREKMEPVTDIIFSGSKICR